MELVNYQKVECKTSANMCNKLLYRVFACCRLAAR